MFTKIGKFLKPILGRSDHVPADAVQPFDPERKNKRKKDDDDVLSKHKTTPDRGEDVTVLSLDAVKAVLESEISDDLDVYTAVLKIVVEMQKKNIREISVQSGQTPLEALFQTAANYGIANPLENRK